MNAEFKTDAGAIFRVTLEDEENSSPTRVTLQVFTNEQTIKAHLKRSEARAISSALMGAAAEL